MIDLKRLLNKLYYVPSITLNIAAKENISKINNLLKDIPPSFLLNIGSGKRFVGWERLERKMYKKIVNLDISLFPSVDVVGDAHRLPFRENTFGVVLCQAVLEHTKNPNTVVEEIHRTIKKGGIIYAEVPFVYPYHDAPLDFYRFSIKGIEQLFSRFSKIDIGVCAGPSSTFNVILNEYLTGLMTGFSENKYLRMFSDFLIGWLIFPVKYIDLIFGKKAESHRIAAGLYYLGTKIED